MSPRRELPLKDIEEFVLELKLLSRDELSLAQRTALKAVYGLMLDQEELDIYRRATELLEYAGQEQSEATFICGRRSGKTTRIGALIALYEAYRYHNVPAGEHAYVVLIAPFKKQAKEAFRAIKRYINNSPILKKSVVKFRKDEIELDNGVIIACWTCSAVNVRGSSVICAICDETAFWQHEDTSANPEEEVMEGLRPGLAALTNTKLIRISTPFRKEGILWKEFQTRREVDHLVWRLSTAEMNPTAVPAAFLEKERQRNEEKYLREYMAEFTDPISSFIGSDTLNDCIQKGCTELPPHKNATYVAAIDPAFKRDDWALVIAERTADGTIVIDLVRTWTGKPNEPLGFESVCQEIARILKLYDINSSIGDQHCAPVIEQQFLELEIIHVESTITASKKMAIFANLKHLLISKKIQLLDDPKLLSQFRNLREHKARNGRVEIRSGHGAKDDLVFAAALAAYHLTDEFVDPRSLLQRAPQLADQGVNSYQFNGDPCYCPYQNACANSTRCVDRGACQGYVHQELTAPQPASPRVKVDNFNCQNGPKRSRTCGTITAVGAPETDNLTRITMLKRR